MQHHSGAVNDGAQMGPAGRPGPGRSLGSQGVQVGQDLHRSIQDPAAQLLQGGSGRLFQRIVRQLLLGGRNRRVGQKHVHFGEPLQQLSIHRGETSSHRCADRSPEIQ